MARTSLPPGFRFHPTDVELVKYYLKRKVMGKNMCFDAIAEVNIYKFSPCDLPEKSRLQSKDREWFFFCPRERRYASGSRVSRTTETGYWKTTGKDRSIKHNGQTVGTIKTLVFHEGHAPVGERTNWVMYEYRIEDKDLVDAGFSQDAYVLCKIFKKSGPGPKNGAQYGEFNEEDWNYDLFQAAPMLPSNQNNSVVMGMQIRSSACSVSLSEAGPSDAMPSADEVPQPIQDDYDLFNNFAEDCTLPSIEDNENVVGGRNSSVVTGTQIRGSACSVSLSEAGPSNAVSFADEVPQDDFDFDFDFGLANFVEDGTSLSIENNENVKLNDLNYAKNIQAEPCFEGNEIYNGLGELGNLAELGDGIFNSDNCLELNDLVRPLTYAEVSESESFVTDNCYNYEFQNCCPSKSFGAVHHFSGFSQSPVPLEGSNGFGNNLDVFQKGNDITESANLGCIVQGRKRGEEQRKSYLRLQHLLESIPARPASAAEHFAPTSGAERYRVTTLFSPSGGSSIHVKAEVTRWGDGCTKDALSAELEESHVCYCGYNLPNSDWGKELVNCGSVFTFVFFLGMISVVIWIFVVAMFTKLGRYAWNFVLS